jgi:lincosamide nucleotidyltransferase A/C/D/E
MDETTDEQLAVIHRVAGAMRAAGISAWLFGGWGLDARIGRITRDHGDVEFWIERHQDQRSKALLVEAGAIPLPTQPPEESCEFTWDGVPFSTAYFVRPPGGTFATRGRWSDWEFPPDSFGDDLGILSRRAVPAMSVAGMLAVKKQFPALRNGRPWREKDRQDIEVLRALISRGAESL